MFIILGPTLCHQTIDSRLYWPDWLLEGWDGEFGGGLAEITLRYWEITLMIRAG
jgi:hypothetical protein